MSINVFTPEVGMWLRFKNSYAEYDKGSVVMIKRILDKNETIFFLSDDPRDSWIAYHSDFEILEPPKQKIDPEYESLYT